MAKNPRFKKIYEQWKLFRAEEVLVQGRREHARQLHGAALGGQQTLGCKVLKRWRKLGFSGGFPGRSVATQHPFQGDCPMS
jgi:hypothetical protein